MTTVSPNFSFKTAVHSEKSLSASFIRLLLETSKELLPAKYYESCLQSAGMERFIRELPPAELVPVASFVEVAEYMSNVYNFTRDGVYPLFCNNLGNSMAKNLIKQPKWLEIKVKADQILHDQSFSKIEKLTKLAELKNSLPRNNVKWRLENGDLIADTEKCIFCYNLKTDKPICYARKIYLHSALTWLSGWYFVGEQFSAISCGDKTCAYRFKLLS
jgi:predicted hydrocarbon binding protein